MDKSSESGGARKICTRIVRPRALNPEPLRATLRFRIRASPGNPRLVGSWCMQTPNDFHQRFSLTGKPRRPRRARTLRPSRARTLRPSRARTVRPSRARTLPRVQPRRAEKVPRSTVSIPAPNPSSWSQRWRRCHKRGFDCMPGIVGSVDTPKECYEFLCGSTPPIVSRVT